MSHEQEAADWIAIRNQITATTKARDVQERQTERIATALERIADALERLDDKAPMVTVVTVAPDTREDIATDVMDAITHAARNYRREMSPCP